MSVYHDCSGDGGNIYYPVFGCPLRETGREGLFYDNDLTSTHRECGSQHYPLIYHSKTLLKLFMLILLIKNQV